VVSRHLGDVQEAFGMLNEMGKAGVMPTVDTFNTLMDACIRRVDPPAVLRLFRQMVQSVRLCMGLFIGPIFMHLLLHKWMECIYECIRLCR